MLLEEQHAINFDHYAKDAAAARALVAKVAALGPLASREAAHELVELSAQVSIAVRGLEDVRKKAVGPLNQQVKEINALFASVTGPGEETIALAKRLKSAWDEQERAREAREREAQRLAQEAAARKEREAMERLEAAKTEKARAKAMADAAAASVALTAATVAEPLRAATALKGDFGSMSTRKAWVFEVVDPAQVPRAYCTPDPRAIRAAVAAGIRQIAGVNIYEEDVQVQRIRG